MSDSSAKRALRSALARYAHIFDLAPKRTQKQTNRDLALSPFELGGFLTASNTAHMGVKYKRLSGELSAFTDYSFTFGRGFCSARSMWAQAHKDRVRTRECSLELLSARESESETRSETVLFR